MLTVIPLFLKGQFLRDPAGPIAGMFPAGGAGRPDFTGEKALKEGFFEWRVRSYLGPLQARTQTPQMC